MCAVFMLPVVFFPPALSGDAVDSIFYGLIHGHTVPESHPGQNYLHLHSSYLLPGVNGSQVLSWVS